MSSGGKAPPPADYVGAARAQGEANLEAARVGATLNRVNQQGPTGSTTFTQDQNDPDRWTQTTALSPEQQALYDQQVANQQGVSGLAGSQLQGLYGSMSQPFSVSGPERISSVDQQQLTNDFSAERQRVEDSLYGSAATRLDDQFGRQNEANRTALLNQGLREGSEGYNNAMRDFELTKQDAYGNARDRAIQAGGAEQSRLFADALAGNQQSFGQGMQNANLSNAVRDAAIGEQLAVRNQPLQEFLALYGDGGGGSGVTGGNIAGVQGPEAAPIVNAYSQQQQDAINRWQTDEQSAAADNSMYAGAASTAAMIAMMY